ncbi:MAG: DNA starvation/stationary phase protection protein [Candidatus Dormiibacterota bacterium]
MTDDQQSAINTHTAAIGLDARLEAAGILQELVVDVTDLSLQGKQAHWNLRGRSFRDLHLQLDELVDLAREGADTLAERLLQLGVAADGRVATLVRDSHLEPFPEGRVRDHEALELIVARLETVSQVGHSRLGQLGELDPVSQDLVIAVLEGLEKQLWMFEAHREE